MAEEEVLIATLAAETSTAVACVARPYLGSRNQNFYGVFPHFGNRELLKCKYSDI